MSKKKHGKNHYFGKSALIISSIAFLNFVGVSYAQWNEQINIMASITTGEMDVRFDNNQKEIVYEAEIMLEEEAIIPFTINDRSTIPVQFSGFQINGVQHFSEEEYEDNRDGISFSGEAGLIKAIPTKPGKYKFNVVLNYEQSNDN